MEDNKKNTTENKKVEIQDKKTKDKKDQELTEEDKEYKQNIDDMVTGLYDKDQEIRNNAYNLIKTEITTATSSMTSIPRPLKFLRLHYDALKEYLANFDAKTPSDQEYVLQLKDLLAVLLMVTQTLHNEVHNYPFHFSVYQLHQNQN